MREQPFQFDLYRLNVIDDEALFEFMGASIKKDSEIERLLETATSSKFDQPSETEKYTFLWSLRESAVHRTRQAGNVLSITLARSIKEQLGQTVTDNGIEDSVIKAEPPGATVIHLFFYMRRHLVAVEYDSVVLGSDTWRKSLHAILDATAKALNVRSSLRLEPIPQKEEILLAFRSFSKLFKLRLRLRLPNPELSRWTKRLKNDMANGGIREYLQEMHNPNGLSQKDGALPHASVALAQAGYKDGEVIMEGVREGKRQRIKTGRKAARGKLEQVRDFVRGAAATAKSKDARTVVRAIIDEIDRMAEPPASDEK